MKWLPLFHLQFSHSEGDLAAGLGSGRYYYRPDFSSKDQHVLVSLAPYLSTRGWCGPSFVVDFYQMLVMGCNSCVYVELTGSSNHVCYSHTKAIN